MMMNCFKRNLVASIVTVMFYIPVTNASAFDCKDHTSFGKPGLVDQVLCYEGFVIGYNYKTKNPDWVSYKLTDESVKVYRKRINMFYEDDNIPKQYRALLSDYKGSGYDRGHLAPNATVDFSQESQKQSFYLSNMVPQLPGHNRNGWKELEKMIRDLAVEYKELHVITGVIYDSDHQYIGHRVEIPDYFYKVIYAPKQDTMVAFLIPHRDFGKDEINSFITSVDEVEKYTGLDFYSVLSDDVEASLEGY